MRTSIPRIIRRLRPLLPIVTPALVLFFGALNSFAQIPSCTTSATATLVHQEGLAERIGDITLTCTGGPAGGSVSEALFITLNTNITNRLDANGNPQGITVMVNPGTGAVATGSVRQTGGATISLNAVNYTVPATPSSPVIITISGIRAAVASLSNGSAPSTVTASIVGIGAQFGTNTQVITAISAPSLLQSTLNNGVPCNGSALPVPLDFNSFANTSTSSTVRVTEASAAAFATKKAGDDSGTRILISLTGYGTGARVFVPDAIVGTNGTAATSAAAFGSSVSPGSYTPAANQLLLIRVNGADANGRGGTLALTQPAAATTFSTVTEIPVSNGSAFAVYEVVDSNSSLVESAQIPVFVSVAQTNCPSTLTPDLVAKLAPVSTVSIATPTDPVPRFMSTPPVSDCQQTGDCNAPYYPKFTVDTTPVNLTGNSLGAKQSAFVKVGNTGAGILNFSTSIAYEQGTNWLSVSPATGTNNATLQIIADPAALQPGTYKATVTVSAGSYGSGAIPVTFTVGAVGVSINNVGNAASFQYGTVAPGSYAVVFGSNLSGKNVSVTFNGLPGSVIYDSATQINVIVPTSLGGQLGAAVVATVDGSASNSFRVNLAQNAPGIFTPGIINVDDGTVNSSDHPAARGKFVSVYLTGLAIPVTGQVTVNIGDQMNLIPSFAGAQPTYPALDQVNITIPALLAGTPNPVSLQVCIPGPTGQPVCSNQVSLYIK